MDMRITHENNDSATGGIPVSAAQDRIRCERGMRTRIVQFCFIQRYYNRRFRQKRKTTFQLVFASSKAVHIDVKNGEAKGIEGQ